MPDGFATLVPAFTLKACLPTTTSIHPHPCSTEHPSNKLEQAKLDPPIASDPSGLHPAGLTLVNVPQGTLKSEAGYEFKVDAEAVNCVDFIRRDGSVLSTPVPLYMSSERSVEARRRTSFFPSPIGTIYFSPNNP